MSNNFFYYQSRDVLAKGTISALSDTLVHQYKACLESSSKSDECKNMMIKALNESWRYGRISLINSFSEIIFEKDSETYRDDRSVVLEKREFGEGDNKLIFIISKKSSPPLYISTWRSLSLSFDKWFSQKNFGRFLFNEALPRSSPLIYSLITIGTLLLMVNASDKKKRQLYASLESENFIVSNDLDSVRENHRLLLAEKNLLRVNIQLQEESGNKLLEEYYINKSRLDELEKNISDVKETEINLATELEKNSKQIAKIKLPDNGDVDKYLKEALLSNPKVDLRDVPFKYNDGIHHSREFVEKISQALMRDEVASRLITKINSTAYSPSKRGKAILEWDKDKGYILNIYDHRDAGFGAELVLSKDLKQAVYMAKYLVSGKSYLAKKSYNLEFGKISTQG